MEVFTKKAMVERPSLQCGFSSLKQHTLCLRADPISSARGASMPELLPMPRVITSGIKAHSAFSIEDLPEQRSLSNVARLFCPTEATALWLRFMGPVSAGVLFLTPVDSGGSTATQTGYGAQSLAHALVRRRPPSPRGRFWLRTDPDRDTPAAPLLVPGT